MTPVFTFIKRKKIMVNVLLFMYNAYVAVIFVISVNFCFPLFLGMDMYANEFEIKKKNKTEIKN